MGSVVAGPEGGGSWEVVTVPVGAAGSGSGRVLNDDSRVLEHPAADSAASETTTRIIFDDFIQYLRRSPAVLRP